MLPVAARAYIRELRKGRGITQAALAEALRALSPRLGVDVRTVSNWERGDETVRMDLAQAKSVLVIIGGRWEEFMRLVGDERVPEEEGKRLAFALLASELAAPPSGAGPAAFAGR